MNRNLIVLSRQRLQVCLVLMVLNFFFFFFVSYAYVCWSWRVFLHDAAALPLGLVTVDFHATRLFPVHRFASKPGIQLHLPISAPSRFLQVA
jgi:hypothetical protein